VERATVVGRRDGHRLDAEIAAGTKDPQRDLAPVGNEQLADRHGGKL
jgi:hypothetical protein